MPRTCPIRGGDNDCNATHNKHHQCRHNAQIGRETKTKEGYVKLQEITDPNGNGVKDEKRHLLHIFQRKDTHPHIMQNTSHLCKNRHIPYQKKGQHTNSRNTYYNNVKMGRSQHIGQRPRISSGFFEKSGKHTGLQQQGHSCYQSYTESINQTLRHHCPQRLGKRSAVILCQNAATGNFTHTRDNQISGIRHKNSIHAV